MAKALKKISFTERAGGLTASVNLKREGAARLGTKFRALQLSRGEDRKLNLRIADAFARAMKKEVAAYVEATDLKHFDGSAVQRKRQARYLAKQVGRTATWEGGVLYDRRAMRRNKGKAIKPNAPATAEQATRLKELGFKRSKAWIQKRFTTALAGMVIRKIEEQKGFARSRRVRRSKYRLGSLLILVWREKEKQIAASVDIEAIIARFFADKAAKAGAVA